MGSVQHHQTQARRFLSLARSDLHAGDYLRAADALAPRGIPRRHRRGGGAELVSPLHPPPADQLPVPHGGGGPHLQRRCPHLPQHLRPVRRLAEADPREAPTPVPAGPQPRGHAHSLHCGRHRRPAGDGTRPSPRPHRHASAHPINSGDHRPARLPGDRRGSRSGRRAPGATPRPPRLLPPRPDAIRPAAATPKTWTCAASLPP